MLAHTLPQIEASFATGELVSSWPRLSSSIAILPGRRSAIRHTK